MDPVSLHTHTTSGPALKPVTCLLVIFISFTSTLVPFGFFFSIRTLCGELVSQRPFYVNKHYKSSV